ncbi:methylated-DNA--[protein]-cysteine S-methyltransferase [Liquorilactobacillus sicerae]|uniref:methylated-DNA--[protein]-cysteine S-methyltransferase n=1 Tax=Liquorilactobacillus sicerae TaxID=1416943 RepID=UPI0024811F2E|nr:methylated-DNA--[protein]-cysteine S-methyltransferase [Liquorilactobacillus sicerae]
MNYYNTFASPLGTIYLLSDHQALQGLWFSDQKYFTADHQLKSAINGEPSAILTAKNWLETYFAGKDPAIATLKLAPTVSPFQRQVLNALTMIPYGQTVTYQEVAAKVVTGKSDPRNYARAVANAIAHNPITIIIPCHRVIGTNGRLTGYAGGISRKKALLKFENPFLNIKDQL